MGCPRGAYQSVTVFGGQVGRLVGGVCGGGGWKGCRDAPTSALGTWCRRRGCRNVSGGRQDSWEKLISQSDGNVTNGRLCRACVRSLTVVGWRTRARRGRSLTSPFAPISISGWGTRKKPWSVVNTGLVVAPRAAAGDWAKDEGRGNDSGRRVTGISSSHRGSMS